MNVDTRQYMLFVSIIIIYNYLLWIWSKFCGLGILLYGYTILPAQMAQGGLTLDAPALYNITNAVSLTSAIFSSEF